MSASELEPITIVNPEPLPYAVTEPPIVDDPRRLVDQVPNATGDIALFDPANPDAWLQSDVSVRGDMR